MLTQRRLLLAALSAIVLLGISNLARATSVDTDRDSVHQMRDFDANRSSDGGGEIDLRFGDGANGDGTLRRDDFGVALGTLNIGENDPFEKTSERNVDEDPVPKDFGDELTDGRGPSEHDVGDDERGNDGEHEGDQDRDPDSPVPEPSTAFLVAFGLGTLAVSARRR